MKVCLSTSSKNEKHIIEWINYYIKIGIDYFIIFDDLSDKPIQEVFDENNIDKSIYTIFRNNNRDNLYENLNMRYIVHRCYSPEYWINLCIPKLIEKEMDYVLYVDLDEFLYLNKFNNIQELISYYSPFDVLKINWLLFGSNNLIENTGVNNIIDTFNRSSDILSDGTGASKSLTRVSKISVHNTYQYGPHILPIVDGAVVKNIFNNIENSYGNDLNSALSHPYFDGYYKDKIYIAHYACQDITTFIKRKLSNKENYYWWINFIGVPHRIEVYRYIDIINNNFDNFKNYLYNKINNTPYNTDFSNYIPIQYIENIIKLYNIFNLNIIENNDIINYKSS